MIAGHLLSYGLTAQQYIAAEDLKPGHVVLLADGSTRIIGNVVSNQRKEFVYNFTVKGLHNYYVTKEGILVHNNDCIDDVNDYNGLEKWVDENLTAEQAAQLKDDFAEIIAMGYKETQAIRRLKNIASLYSQVNKSGSPAGFKLVERVRKKYLKELRDGFDNEGKEKRLDGWSKLAKDLLDDDS